MNHTHTINSKKMVLPYKIVLMIGCTSGIGLALAERMIENGVYVIAVGRRVERLDAFTARHGPESAAGEQFDITNLEGMKAWTKALIEKYPGIDCVVLNAGVQRIVDFNSPETIDVDELKSEITTNYTAHICLITYLLPQLQRMAKLHKRAAALVLVSSGLALVPVARHANYCATKAALHSLAWTLRDQLAHDDDNGDSVSDDHAGQARNRNNVRVIEIVPPAVQTELHGTGETERKVGIPIEEFLESCWGGLLAAHYGDAEPLKGPDEKRNGQQESMDKDEILVGPLKLQFSGLETERRMHFLRFADLMRRMRKS